MVENFLVPFMGAAIGSMFAFVLILMLGIYVYTAWAIMTIGRRFKVKPIWLAWIPIANLFYLAMLAGYEWYYGFLWLGALIPVIGGFVAIALTIWFWWKISVKRKKEGWFGILMAIPFVNLVAVGFLAWSK